jgi:hypothetical protein
MARTELTAAPHQHGPPPRPAAAPPGRRARLLKPVSAAGDARPASLRGAPPLRLPCQGQGAGLAPGHRAWSEGGGQGWRAHRSGKGLRRGASQRGWGGDRLPAMPRLRGHPWDAPVCPLPGKWAPVRGLGRPPPPPSTPTHPPPAFQPKNQVWRVLAPTAASHQRPRGQQAPGGSQEEGRAGWGRRTLWPRAAWATRGALRRTRGGTARRRSPAGVSDKGGQRTITPAPPCRLLPPRRVHATPAPWAEACCLPVGGRGRLAWVRGVERRKRHAGYEKKI